MLNNAVVEVNLENFGNVAPQGYLYYEKLVIPRQALSLPQAYLKWYEVRPADLEITPELDAESRALLAQEVQRLNFEGELGFVVLHRAGSVLFLMMMTWRNVNEIWQSVYIKDLNQGGAYQTLKPESTHRETICVWELIPVWHERDAWVRFLSSKRDQAAKLAYVNDLFSGKM